MPPALAFNTAASFISNTDWQNYGGETTMSYLVQMAGLTVQNFMSAATGIVLAVALVRGFARHSARSIGNFWVDLTRCTLYILLPVSIVFTIFLVWQGIPQTLGAYAEATTLEGAKQVIALGPMASQIAIKMLGTNGGGFMNAKCRASVRESNGPLQHDPDDLDLRDRRRPHQSVRTHGRRPAPGLGDLLVDGHPVHRRRHRLLLGEAAGNPLVHALGIDGGNMEGKEVRFGVSMSALFAVITTAASCGAVNAMHDSFTALGGMIPLINMELAEVIIGGVGAGLYGILLFVVISIFIAGLMVGRTPEYLGKKIEARRSRWRCSPPS